MHRIYETAQSLPVNIKNTMLPISITIYACFLIENSDKIYLYTVIPPKNK